MTRPGITASKSIARRTQAGIALIIVMIFITFLSILAARFAIAMKVETKLAQNADSETELTLQGLGGVHAAQWVLALSLSCPYDSLDQKWAGGSGGVCETNGPLVDVSLSPFQVGGQTYPFSLKITDLERKCNINIADEPVLQRALNLIGVDASESSTICGSILDWIDPDNNTHIGGAESDYYQGLTPAYFAKNSPIDDLSELLLVRGITPEIYRGGAASNDTHAVFQNNMERLGLRSAAGTEAYSVGLDDIFTPISNGLININTASETVLQMVPMVDEVIASRIVQLRSGGDATFGPAGPIGSPGFSIPDALVTAGLNMQAAQYAAGFFTTRSSTFEVEVTANVAGHNWYYYATLARNSPTDIQVLSFYTTGSEPKRQN